MATPKPKDAKMRPWRAWVVMFESGEIAYGGAVLHYRYDAREKASHLNARVVRVEVREVRSVRSSKKKGKKKK